MLKLRILSILLDDLLLVGSNTIIESGEKKIVAKSVLNVMAAGIKCGTEINVICEGPDEEEALAAITEAIETGLGE